MVMYKRIFFIWLIFFAMLFPCQRFSHAASNPSNKSEGTSRSTAKSQKNVKKISSKKTTKKVLSKKTAVKSSNTSKKVKYTAVKSANTGKKIKYAAAKKNVTAKKATAKKMTAALATVVSTREPALHSEAVLVYDEAFDNVVFEKNADQIKPIASLTKLMSAMVFLDAALPMDKEITITDDDVDTLRHSSSRLSVGSILKREELLRLSLMSSENRATSALARTSYPGGRYEFVKKMNQKARSLGMYHTRYEDPTGLDGDNVSTASDLLKLVQAAYNYPTIRNYSTTACYHVWPEGLGRQLQYKNSNCLVRNGDWDIELSKTGFIREAGKCLVMRTQIAHRPFVFVLLDSDSTSERTQDAEHLRKWIERQGIKYTSSSAFKQKS